MRKSSKHEMTIIGHRGVMGEYPQNTLQSFEVAMDADFPMIELDVKLSKDGKLVVIHDDDVEKVTRGKYSGKVSDFTFSKLRKMNVYDGRKESDDAFYQIPTLPEVLDLAEDFCDWRDLPTVNIELKDRDTYLMVASIINKRVKSNTFKKENFIVSSFMYDELEKFSKELPDVSIALLVNEDHWKKDFSETPQKLIEKALEFRAVAINVDKEIIDKNLVKIAHENNLKINAWTIKNSEEFSKMRFFQVDGVFVDFLGLEKKKVRVFLPEQKPEKPVPIAIGARIYDAIAVFFLTVGFLIPTPKTENDYLLLCFFLFMGSLTLGSMIWILARVLFFIFLNVRFRIVRKIYHSVFDNFSVDFLAGGKSFTYITSLRRGRFAGLKTVTHIATMDKTKRAVETIYFNDDTIFSDKSFYSFVMLFLDSFDTNKAKVKKTTFLSRPAIELQNIYLKKKQVRTLFVRLKDRIIYLSQESDDEATGWEDFVTSFQLDSKGIEKQEMKWKKFTSKGNFSILLPKAKRFYNEYKIDVPLDMPPIQKFDTFSVYDATTYLVEWIILWDSPKVSKKILRMAMEDKLQEEKPLVELFGKHKGNSYLQCVRKDKEKDLFEIYRVIIVNNVIYTMACIGESLEPEGLNTFFDSIEIENSQILRKIENQKHLTGIY